MRDKFLILLNSLSEKLEIDLQLDKNGACTILYEDDLKVQLELDSTLENLIVFSSLFTLAPGKFREDVLLNALKANDTFPYVATFSYFEPDSSLAFHNFLKFETLTVDILVSYLSTFVELASRYKKAIEQGNSSFF